MARPDTSGATRVIAVRIGTRETRRSDVYLNYHLYGQEDGPAALDYFFWIVEHPDGPLIVDTGFSEQGAARRGRTFLLRPDLALDALGISPDSVKDVIVTHGHYDHIGNLSLFPRAQVHMARSEFDFWTSPVSHHTQFGYYAEREEIDHLVACRDQGRLHLFAGSTTIRAGIEIVEVGGHTPGQSIVHVDVPDGRVLLASDAAHFYEEMECDLPFTAVADLPAMYRTFELLRDAAASGAIVIPGHDRSVMDRFPPVPALPTGVAVILDPSSASGPDLVPPHSHH